MPITFANPSLLLGMMAAVVPILVHFFSRRRTRTLPFSDLRFLEEVQAEQARNIDLRRLLLLLLRILIILLIVLAVAGPRLAGLAPGPEGARSVVFVLDASASMQTQHDGGTRFAAARQACLEMAASLPRGSEVQIVRAGTVSEPLFATWMPAGGPVDEAVASIQPGDGPFDLAAALRSVKSWIATARTTPMEIVLLSDLQSAPVDESAWREATEQLAAVGPSRLLIRRVGESVPNGAVRHVTLPVRAVRPGESLRLAAEVLPERAGQAFWLELDGRRVAEAVATVDAGRVGLVEFALTAPAAGQHRAVVRKESDRLPVDDTWPFVLEVCDRIEVLLVHGADRGPAGRGGWQYLAKALVPQAEADAGSPLFDLRVVASNALASGDLHRADAVFFVDPDPLGRQLLGSLVEWLAAAGAAAFLIGDPTLESYLEQTLCPALGLGAEAAYRVAMSSAWETLTLLAPEHPVFSGLGSEPLATLADIHWRRFFALDEGENRVLASFSGGAPALLESRQGGGVSMMLPFDLNPEVSDLVLSPMFLPLVQRLATYLAQGGGRGASTALTVGQRPEVPLLASRSEADELAEAAGLRIAEPAGGAVAGAAELVWRRDRPVVVGGISRRQGFFTFLAGADTIGLVAAVTPAEESNPDLLDVSEYRRRLAAVGLAQTSDLSGMAPDEFAAAMHGRDIGLWLFLLAFLLLCLELYLARSAEEPPAAA